MSTLRHKVVIVGGGTGGISVAALLQRQNANLDIVVVDPARFHYYQPAWTLVGAGAYRAQATRRPLRGLLPRGAELVAEAVTRLVPDEHWIELASGDRISYDYLVIAAGIQVNWGAIKGLAETLGKNGVTSNYRFDLASYTWELARGFKGGPAVFTHPPGAVKCPGAPQKALYLTADHFRRHDIAADLQFRTAGKSMFGVDFYARALDRVIASYDVTTYFGRQLVEVRGEQQLALFESTVDGRTRYEQVPFSLLHVVPPQSAPDFIRDSPLANAAGWLEVDKASLHHVRHANVFGIGDCTSTPNSKTCAAIKGQAPVLVRNLLQAIQGHHATVRYDGYAACPLTTSRGKVMLAEFTYGGTVAPSFPADPRIPRRFYWWIKRWFMPWFYWHLLLKGHTLPSTHKQRRFPAELPAGRQFRTPRNGT